MTKNKQDTGISRPNMSSLINRLNQTRRELWLKQFSNKPVSINELFLKLIGLRGEASAIVVADEIIARIDEMATADVIDFCNYMISDMSPDTSQLLSAAKTYIKTPEPMTASLLSKAAHAPRITGFEMLATSKQGPKALLALRAKILELDSQHPEFKILEQELLRLFRSWFNRGFLEMRRIDWETPAHILEKLISYEAVHEINGWEDLRRRLALDRRCFAFFHPALKDEPLIFVQIAFCSSMTRNIEEILQPAFSQPEQPPKAAIFYSISNCQKGLRGVSFGNFLIKQCVTEVQKEQPSIKIFSTLSPIPGFADWVENEMKLDARQIDTKQLKSLCAHYLLNAKKGAFPLDPVARFHLRNGARLERINAQGDQSSRGQSQSFGFLVNYLYDLQNLEQNHEAFVDKGVVAVSNSVLKLARQAKL